MSNRNQRKSKYILIWSALPQEGVRGERDCSFKLASKEVFLKTTLGFKMLKGVRKQDAKIAGEGCVFILCIFPMSLTVIPQ